MVPVLCQSIRIERLKIWSLDFDKICSEAGAVLIPHNLVRIAYSTFPSYSCGCILSYQAPKSRFEPLFIKYFG